MLCFMADSFYERSLTIKLNQWADDISSPGLILYGSRLTGKTSLVENFARRFRHYIRLDLKDPADLRIFHLQGTGSEWFDTLCFLKEKDPFSGNTLIFLDNAGDDTELIRPALELPGLNPRIKIILSSASERSEIPRDFSTLCLRPFSFTEFLNAYGNAESIEAFNEVPFPVGGFHKLLMMFHQYSLIGGMPAIVKKFVETHSMSSLKPVYESTLRELFNDIENTSFRQNKKDLLMMTLQNAFMYAGTRIKFHAFGNVPYGSREMAQVFRYLEHSMLLGLNYPTLTTEPPILDDKTRFPRLQMPDTGMMSYFSGIQKQMILAMDLNALFEGQVLRHVVGQELLSGQYKAPGRLDYWVGGAQSLAEVDYIIPFEDLIIPVVVRSGEPGRLRSLQQFIDHAPHPFAIRLYAGNVNIRKTETLRGKQYYLLSLPYFLACRITEHLSGFIRYVSS